MAIKRTASILPLNSGNDIKYNILLNIVIINFVYQIFIKKNKLQNRLDKKKYI